MRSFSSLNARLMAGLLVVTAVGLALMGVISAVVLRTYLMHRVDRQLVAARQVRAPAARAGEIANPGRFVVLTMTPNGRVTINGGVLGLGATGTDGTTPPAVNHAVRQVNRLGYATLSARATAGRPFRLGASRAIARPGVRGRVLIVVDPLGEVHAALTGLVVTELVTGTVLLVVVALLGRGLIRRGLAPLARMAGTAQRIAGGGDLRARMEVSSSEAGRLAAAINLMLDRIEQAFLARLRSEAKVREFAADASHELRTPLTTIRGYSELYEQGAVSAEEAMRRISGESERMRRLVDELLELARLDKGSALETRPVDLAALARDAVADARAVEPDRPLALDAPGALVTVADEARIRQVLANLLANVRAHTPPGTPATVRLAALPPVVALEVADDGPGMTREQAERAFDRFHHAPGGGGSGLGLAIVAAIASAHGGRAMLRAEPGAGTVVRVELPRLAPAGAPPAGGGSAAPAGWSPAPPGALDASRPDGAGAPSTEDAASPPHDRTPPSPGGGDAAYDGTAAGADGAARPRTLPLPRPLPPPAGASPLDGPASDDTGGAVSPWHRTQPLSQPANPPDPPDDPPPGR